MTASRRVSSSLAVAFALSSVILGLGVLIGQEPQPSATPAPSPSLSQIPRVRASPTPDVGAQNFHRWGSITIFNGLPSDAVHAIAQTADGIMWFGTDNGLARFDGRRVERISLGDEASNRVQTLGASKNDLWIGTQNGAFLFRDGAAQPVSGTDGSNITAISSGQPTFLGTEGGEVSTAAIDANGLPSIVAKLGKVIVKGQNVRVTSFARTPSQILVGTSGVGLFTVKDERIEPLATKGLPSFINGLAVDGESLLIASDAAKGASGLYSLSENNRTADRLKPPTARVNAVAAANPDIWAGLDRNGAVHVSNYKTETFTFANTSGGLRSDTVFSVLVDSEGVVWFGTNRGVSRYDPLAPDQESISDLPNSNFVRTLFLYGNEYALYVGTNRGAFREHGASWEKVAWIGDRIVYDIDALPGKPDSTIFATSDGLRVRNGQTLISGDIRAVNSFQSKMYAAQFGRGVVDITDPDHPHLIFENAGVVSLGGYVGRMWIGTATDGLFSFDGATVRPEIRPADIDTGTVWSVGEAGLNTGAWIAAEHGVFHLKNGVAERIIPADDVRDVFALPDLGQKTGQVSSADREDIDVWAATTSRGLIHGRRDKDFGWLFSSLGFEQGLPSDKVFSIAVVRGKLVLATNR
ncbi:MAG TPA: two-component regulator propeller domain-containing protein, partial [Pyrinomonadaceae bacterium]